MKTVVIYTLSDPITKEIKYIGKTTQSFSDRLCKHIYQSRERKNHSALWIQELLKKGLMPLIQELEICNNDDWEEIENYWIEQIRSWGFNLTNQMLGGKCGSGPKSKETREKLRQINLGKKASEETKQKLSKALKLAYSEGRKKPVEVTWMGNPIIVTNQLTGEEKEFPSIKDAAKSFGINRTSLVSLLKGRYKKLRKREHQILTFKEKTK